MKKKNDLKSEDDNRNNSLDQKNINIEGQEFRGKEKDNDTYISSNFNIFQNNNFDKEKKYSKDDKKGEKELNNSKNNIGN